MFVEVKEFSTREVGATSVSPEVLWKVIRFSWLRASQTGNRDKTIVNNVTVINFFMVMFFILCLLILI